MATLATYNMHGFANGEDHLRELCASHALVAIQEHWLRQDDLHKLSTLASPFVLYRILR